MKKSAVCSWLERIAWGIIAVNILLVIVVPTSINYDKWILALLYLMYLILSLLFSITVLMIRRHKLFRTWAGLLSLLGLYLLLNLFFEGIIPIRWENLSLLVSLFYITLGWSIGVGLIIMLWFRDVGLKLIAYTSAIVIWVLFFAWRYQGNLLELSLRKLLFPELFSPLWWLNPFLCILGWLVPLSLLSFIGHTIRLIHQESL